MAEAISGFCKAIWNFRMAFEAKVEYKVLSKEIFQKQDTA